MKIKFILIFLLISALVILIGKRDPVPTPLPLNVSEYILENSNINIHEESTNHRDSAVAEALARYEILTVFKNFSFTKESFLNLYEYVLYREVKIIDNRASLFNIFFIIFIIISIVFTAYLLHLLKDTEHFKNSFIYFAASIWNFLLLMGSLFIYILAFNVYKLPNKHEFYEKIKDKTITEYFINNSS